ncbi:FAD/NAD(P)-binding domain-containing protein [Sodiomyces alkalinus F11]|uniref:FAD/NAD(P)-binding domain-containing protein n=1 Tax=Sodiomyces alkalinus (strain CBS 110278 / VKM F-3762 / F11) TaxID=1314773 RepID=A0A3N2Q897_SODAK|nr:FAD/NAD(P)-binding domain-containing protein [Sodiomyces alkalinus F11]ROT42878.1 FAD/NAD(P)-binding domain-containing protein [Sodiomyces alkalinus F11]
MFLCTLLAIITGLRLLASPPKKRTCSWTTNEDDTHDDPQQSSPYASSGVTANPDIIVVGGGFAGICAAIAAAENGASVVVLDRGHGGGTSAISGGVIYAGGGTKQQKEAGYGDDTPENMFRYLRREVGDALDELTLRRFCDQSVPLMEWLERHGVVFEGSLSPFRTSYPTDRYYLYFSGNEKAHPFADIAKPSPRGHRPKGQGTSGMGMTGGVLWKAVFDAALRMGVRFEPASRVEELLVDGEGRMKGVRYRAMDPVSAATALARHGELCRKASEYHQISVRLLAEWYDRRAEAMWSREAKERTLESRVVILAAGGFVMNEEWTRRFVPWADRVAKLGTVGDDGSGIRLGQSLGGAVSHMDRMSAWRLMYPPEALVEGIVVSAGGERIAAEDQYGATSCEVMIERFGGRGYLILDSAQWRKVKSQVGEQTRMPWTALIRFLIYWAHTKASSLEGLAKKLDVDPGRMGETVAAYNDAIRSGKPDPVGKRGWRTVISEPPFYGIDISLRPDGLMMVPAFPLGGLKVDGASGMVVDESGEKIRGLYAAGKNAAGLSSNRYVSGLALADCLFSGKRAGVNAAAAAAAAAASLGRSGGS